MVIHFRNYCGLDWLAGEAIRFMQLHFESIWKEPEFLIEDSLNYEQLTRLLEADDLCVDCEDNVYYCVTRWLNRYGVRNLDMSIRFSLKSRPSEGFPRPEMSQMKAEISIHSNLKLIFHKNVGWQGYQWIP